jgi:hypothetical protein
MARWRVAVAELTAGITVVMTMGLARNLQGRPAGTTEVLL